MSQAGGAIPANPTIGAFMTTLPSTVDSELAVLDALDRMYSDNIRHLPVVDASGQLVGLVSSRDIAQLAADGGDLESTSVADTMSTRPYSCAADTPLNDVAFHMENKKLGSAVITENGKPVGIFTTVDALKAVRSLLTGEHVVAANPPTHVLSEEERNKPSRHVRHSAPRHVKLGWALFPGMP
jgi:CBS domain-containing protein